MRGKDIDISMEMGFLFEIDYNKGALATWD